MSRVSVRYMIDDVPAAMRFDTWNRVPIEVADLASEVTRLRAAGVRFRTNEVVTGPGGARVILEDPSGNPVELFQSGR